MKTPREIQLERLLARVVQPIDLYGLDCDMKAEFNSDNKRLYQESRLLAQGDSKGLKGRL